MSWAKTLDDDDSFAGDTRGMAAAPERAVLRG